MARLSLPVQADGLIADAIVWVDQPALDDLTARGLPVPAPVRCRCLLDTGTDISAINPSARSRRGLTRVSQGSTTTAIGTANVDLYRISLSVTDFRTPGAPLLTVPTLLVMEMITLPSTIDVLIGLDILLDCRLFLDGPGRAFTLDF